jgi:hypothetical protein
MSQVHSRYVTRETAVGVAINTMMSVVFALLAARGRMAVPLWGANGMALDFVPQTFMISFMTALAATLMTRKRLRRGEVPPLQAERAGFLARMPQNALTRALLIALLLTTVMTPLCVGILSLLSVTSLSFHAFIVMKTVYGAALALLAGPPILRAALAFKDAALQNHRAIAS